MANYGCQTHLRHGGFVKVELELLGELGEVGGVKTDGVLGDPVHVHSVATVNRLQNT